jgi:uncharacterized protein YjiS (DUF1127 family)
MATLTATLSSRDVLSDIARHVSTSFVAGVSAMQRGRLESVLRGMSDDQLAQIGISRAEIGTHVGRMFDRT